MTGKRKLVLLFSIEVNVVLFSDASSTERQFDSASNVNSDSDSDLAIFTEEDTLVEGGQYITAPEAEEPIQTEAGLAREVINSD